MKQFYSHLSDTSVYSPTIGQHAFETLSVSGKNEMTREFLAQVRVKAKQQSVNILQLGAIFIELQSLQLNIQDSRKTALAHDAHPDSAFQRELDQQSDMISDVSQDLACSILDNPDTSTDGLRIKALVLNSYAEENSDDIVHCMARALCASLLAKPPEKSRNDMLEFADVRHS